MTAGGNIDPDLLDILILGRSVAVTERGVVTGEPWRYRIDAAPDVVARRWTPIATWAGPWPVDDAWWQATGSA